MPTNIKIINEKMLNTKEIEAKKKQCSNNMYINVFYGYWLLRKSFPIKTKSLVLYEIFIDL